jgi:CheY-like chemotaxis protein
MSSKILIVEDESIIALDIKNTLQRTGFKVISVCASGEEALSKLDEQLPDLILMDITLRGEMDGVTTSEIIYEKYKIPIIFVSGLNDPETLNRRNKNKSAGLVIKPFDRDILINKIKSVVSRLNN